MVPVTFPLSFENATQSLFEVSALHEALIRLLEHHQLDSSENRTLLTDRLRSEQSYSEVTKDLVSRLQSQIFKLPVTGVVDARTAHSINSSLADLKLLELRRISCQVVCDGQPLSGACVTFFEQQLGGRRRSIAESSTSDARGFLFASYFSKNRSMPGELADSLILIEVAFEDSIVSQFQLVRPGFPDLSVSGTKCAFAARVNEDIKVVIPGSGIPESSEFDRIKSSVVRALPNGTSIASLDPLDARDLEFLSQQTGWPVDRVEAFFACEFLSKAHSEDTHPDTVQAYYAIATVLGHKLHAMIALTGIESLSNAISQASSKGVVSGRIAGEAADLAMRIRTASIEHVLTDTPVPGTSSLRKLLTIADVSEPDDIRLLAALADYRGSRDAFWRRSNTPTAVNMGQPSLELVGYVYSLADVTRNNFVLVRNIVEKFPSVRSVTGLLGVMDATCLLELVGDELPDDVRGTTEIERKRRYVEQLIEGLRQRYPDSGVLRLSEAVVKRGEPSLSPDNGSEPRRLLFRPLELAEPVNAVEPPDAVLVANEPEVGGKAVSDPVDGRIRQLKVLTGRYISPELLAENRIHSATDILKYTKDSFVSMIGQKDDRGRKAALTYDRALRARAVSTLAWMENRRRSSSEETSGISHRLHSPISLEKLFGPQGSCECKECNSVLSPAAYFVNLLDFLHRERFVAGRPLPINPGAVLLNHRPDLKHLQLSCSNTNTEIPYVDLAVEIMEQVVAYGRVVDGSTSFEVTSTNLGLPVGQGGRVSRDTNVDIDTLSQTGNTVELVTVKPHGFSPGDQIVIVGVGDSGYDGRYTVVAVTDPTTLLYTNENTGLPSSSGGTVFRTPAEIISITQLGYTVTVSTNIPHGFSVGDSIQIEGVNEQNYNGSFRVDRVMSGNTGAEKAAELAAYPRFVNDQVYSDPAFLLGKPYPISLPYSRWQNLETEYLKIAGLRSEDIAAAQRDHWTQPIGAKEASLLLGLAEPEFQILTGQTWTGVASVVETHRLFGLDTKPDDPFGGVEELNSVRKISERLSLTFEQLTMVLQTRTIDLPAETSVRGKEEEACDTSKMQLFNGSELLSELEFRRIHTFVRLWRKLPWTADELAAGLWTLNENLDDGLLSPDAIAQIAAIEGLRRATGLGVMGLLAIWQKSFDTFGPSSIYSQLWLNQQLNPASQAFVLREPITGNTAELKRSDDLMQSYRASICAVLKIHAGEFDLVCSIADSFERTKLDGPSGFPKLTLANLTTLYRIAFLSRLSQVPLADLRLLWSRLLVPGAKADQDAQNVGTSFVHAVDNPGATINFIAKTALLRKAGMSITKAIYLCGESAVDGAAEIGAILASKTDLESELVESLAEAAANNPSVTMDSGSGSRESIDVVGDLLAQFYLNKRMTLFVIPKAAQNARFVFSRGTSSTEYVCQSDDMAGNVDGLIAALNNGNDPNTPSFGEWSKVNDGMIVLTQSTPEQASPKPVDMRISGVIRGSNQEKPLATAPLQFSELAKIVVSGIQPKGFADNGIFSFVLSQLQKDGLANGNPFADVLPIDQVLNALVRELGAAHRKVAFTKLLLSKLKGNRLILQAIIDTFTDEPEKIDIALGLGQGVNEDLKSFLAYFVNATIVIAQLHLTDIDFRYIFSKIDTSKVDLTPSEAEPIAIVVSRLSKLINAIRLLDLSRRLPRSKISLFQALTTSETAEIKTFISQVSGTAEQGSYWADQFLEIQEQDRLTESSAFVLDKMVQLHRKIAIPPKELVELSGEPVSNASCDRIREYVQSKYSASTWLAASKAAHRSVRERSRDALVSYILTMPEIRNANVNTANDLFEYLLIDPLMSVDVPTSRLSQAISSVQLFVQRCLLGLEPEVPPEAIEIKYWKLLEHFGILSAQKQIVLFPEMWLTSSNRDNKSEQFADLERQVQKGGLTREGADQVFSDLVTAMGQVARLETCGLHYEQETDTLHVFGRTSSLPRAYYYRLRESSEWTPWCKMNVDIDGVEERQHWNLSGNASEVPGVHLAPIVYQGSPYVFWLTFTSSPEMSTEFKLPNAGDTFSIPNPTTQTQLRLAWSRLTNGTWSPRQISGDSIAAPSLPLSCMQLRVQLDGEQLRLRLHTADHYGDYYGHYTTSGGSQDSTSAEFGFKNGAAALVRPELSVTAYEPFWFMNVNFSGFRNDRVGFKFKSGETKSDDDLFLGGLKPFSFTRIASCELEGKASDWVSKQSVDDQFIAYHDAEGDYFVETDKPHRLPIRMQTLFNPCPSSYSKAGNGIDQYLSIESQSFGNAYLLHLWAEHRTFVVNEQGFEAVTSLRVTPVDRSLYALSSAVGGIYLSRCANDQNAERDWQGFGGGWHIPGETVESMVDGTRILPAGLTGSPIKEYPVLIAASLRAGTCRLLVIEWASLNGSPASPLMSLVDLNVVAGRVITSCSLVITSANELIGFLVVEEQLLYVQFTFSNPHSFESKVVASFEFPAPRAPKAVCAVLTSSEDGDLVHLAILEQRVAAAGKQETEHDLRHYRVALGVEVRLEFIGNISRRATGPATMIQNRHFTGSHGGNLEVVVPEGNCVRHYYLNPSDIQRGWRQGQRVIIQAWAIKRVPVIFQARGRSDQALNVLVNTGSAVVEFIHDPSGWFTFQNRYKPVFYHFKGAYPTHEMDFGADAAYSCYYWEQHFHAPMCIAVSFSQQQKFAEAREWFHRVFDPTDSTNETSPERFWRLLPFREWTSREGRLSLSRLDWLNHPFQPHRIARSRIVAYMKWTVMRYIDNLMEWGDWHYRRADAMGSIQEVNAAEQLYILAAKILGSRPERSHRARSKEVLTYNSLPDTAFDLPASVGGLALGEILDQTHTSPNQEVISTLLSLDYGEYFCIPENTSLLGYWDRVDDRLFKIRHSMNINGVVRRLPLFEPPVDPAVLIEAAAAGQDIGDVLAEIYAPLPLYRFTFMLARALELCADVKALGAELLSAIEKGDSERLAQLNAEDRVSTLGEVLTMREWQIREALETLNSLLVSREIAVQRMDHYGVNLGRKRPQANQEGNQAPPAPPELPATPTMLDENEFPMFIGTQHPQNPNFVIQDQQPLGMIQVGGSGLGEQIGRQVGDVVNMAVTAGATNMVGSAVAKGIGTALGPVGQVASFVAGDSIEDGINEIVDEVVGPVRDEIKDVFGGVGAMIGAAVQDAPKFVNAVPSSSTSVLSYENQELQSSQAAISSTLNASFAEKLAGTLGAFPMFSVDIKPIGIGGGTSLGGQQLAATASAAAREFSMQGSWHGYQASVAAKMSSYLWREREFALQYNLASREVAQIDRQIVAARVRHKNAQLDAASYLGQAIRASEFEVFLKNKGSNSQVYDYLVEKLTNRYFQTYQMALDFARRVERCYQFELGEKSSQFISASAAYWDSQRGGFLAGTHLHFSLKQMEQSYLEKNRRDPEMTKHVSLAQIAPLALLDLQRTGKCGFEIPEVLFDLDFAGQYFRRIKSVSITIPCVTGPYTSVCGRLTLASSKIRTVGDTQGDYKENAPWSDPRFSYFFPGQTSIATSHCRNDSGMFELNFRDERYLPFEGAGVISTWSLELPMKFRNFDYHSISDVIVHINYTAREGSSELKDAAEGQVANELSALAESSAGLFTRVFRVRTDFASEWARFAAGTENVLPLPLTDDIQPFVGRTSSPPSMMEIRLWAIFGAAPDQSLLVAASDVETDPEYLSFSPITGADGLGTSIYEAVIKGAIQPDGGSAGGTAGVPAWAMELPALKRYTLSLGVSEEDKGKLKDILVICRFGN